MSGMLNHETACLVVQSAVDAIQAEPETFPEILDRLPAAIYVTDAEGTITYVNQPCVEFAGRVPNIGADKWCVTSKIYTTDGELLPPEDCPMAVAIREQRPLRDVEAIAERPDGSRVHFVPYPTPLFAADGRFIGAVNLLLDVTQRSDPDYFRRQSARCRRLAASAYDRELAETLERMAATYEEQAAKPGGRRRPH
ncbi:MAG TPA: PAS domain-containing protein [Novosphingobium sp.]|nr:PAS domain-containing protein [Novosphingobium sp.]